MGRDERTLLAVFKDIASGIFFLGLHRPICMRFVSLKACANWNFICFSVSRNFELASLSPSEQISPRKDALAAGGLQ